MHGINTAKTWIRYVLLLLITLNLCCCKSVPVAAACQYPEKPQVILPGVGQLTRDLEAIVGVSTFDPQLTLSNLNTKPISLPADVF